MGTSTAPKLLRERWGGRECRLLQSVRAKRMFRFTKLLVKYFVSTVEDARETLVVKF